MLNEQSPPTELTPSPEIDVTEAKPEDIQGIMNVHKEGWLTTYPNTEHGITAEAVAARVQDKESDRLTKWTESLANQNETSHVWTAKDNGKVVGFCHATRDQETNHIRSIYVLPDHQGKGLGAQLMNKAVEWLGRDKDIILEVVTYNERAINFYERLGFIRGETVEQKPDGSSTWLNMQEIEMRLPAERSKDL